jgi:hypothetical protein
MVWKLESRQIVRENPCNSSPCNNGGTCQRLTADTYQCQCTPGYTGTLCEGKIYSNNLQKSVFHPFSIYGFGLSLWYLQTLLWIVFVLCLVYQMLSVSLDCQLLIAPFSNVYLNLYMDYSSRIIQTQLSKN